MKNEKSFWLTNISNRNVSLSDLNLTIPAYSSVNLLDNKHYSYTLEQLQNSVSKGSLFLKRDKIVVRKVPPTHTKINMPFLHETHIPSRERSVLTISQEKYEELNISDEDFAQQNADIAELDRLPLIKKV